MAYVSDVGRKTCGCELLVFYCSLGVICGVVVSSFERLLSLIMGYTGVSIEPFLNVTIP